MTFEEAMILAADIDHAHAPMNQVGRVILEHYPHRKDEHFEEGEMCFEATAGQMNLRHVAKTARGAVDGLLLKMGSALIERAARTEASAKSDIESAAWRRKMAERIAESVKP